MTSRGLRLGYAQHIDKPSPRRLRRPAGAYRLTGKQAKRYAEKRIGVDLTKVASGKSYSQNQC
jgi:hypothetical protein